MASVLITGTSKGIGLETALAFGRAGYQVHATMRNPSQSPALAETAAKEKLPPLPEAVTKIQEAQPDMPVKRAVPVNPTQDQMAKLTTPSPFSKPPSKTAKDPTPSDARRTGSDALEGYLG